MTSSNTNDNDNVATDQSASPSGSPENFNRSNKNGLTERLNQLEVTPVHLQSAPHKGKQVIKKYGVLHGIFHPLGVAAALLLVVYIGVSMAMNFWHGYQRDLDYAKSRHIDNTAVEFLQTSSIAKDRVELIIRNFNGEIEKRLASNSELKSELKERGRELDEARDRAVIRLNAELAALFATAFEDREEAINKYADWFFEWKRPYIVLKEALTATTTRLVKLGEYESLRTAVERDMKDYFLTHYKGQVLKPEIRDAVLVKGIEDIARSAHQDYKATVASQDLKLRRFIENNTTFIAAIRQNETLTKTHLDWDAQRWKAPLHLTEDRAFDGIAGIGRVAAGGTLGALALGPAVSRGLGGVFTPLARRFATSMGARITLAEGGALAGTAVEPVGGTVVGAAIGIAIGFAADYVINKLNEKFSRSTFIAANEEALNSTISLWQNSLEENLKGKFDEWYNTAKAGLLLTHPKGEEQLISTKQQVKPLF